MTNTKRDGETVVIWPDGTTARWSEVQAGHYAHMSDDYRDATETEMNEHGYYTSEQVEVLNANHAVEASYDAYVALKVKSPDALMAEMTPEKAHIGHMCRGVATESGELIDAFKRHVDYNKPLDRDNVIEELGDLEFYISALRQVIGVTRDEVLQANCLKLNKRYAERYTDAEAEARADKT